MAELQAGPTAKSDVKPAKKKGATMGKLYTIGYGILKGTPRQRKLAFQERIRGSFPTNMAIVDIRKAGSGSRNGRSFYQGFEMSWTMRHLNLDCIGSSEVRYGYTAFPALANEHGGTQKGLKQYALDVARGGCKYDAMMKCAKLLRHQEYSFCLLCGCRDAFKPNGTSWNCHRVPLALELLEELGGDWEVEHL